MNTLMIAANAVACYAMGLVWSGMMLAIALILGVLLIGGTGQLICYAFTGHPLHLTFPLSDEAGMRVLAATWIALSVPCTIKIWKGPK